jgi:hypothetical protein
MGLFRPPDIEKMKAKHDVKGLNSALYYKHDSYTYEHRALRQRAAEALGELQAVEPLVEALKDINQDTRTAAMGALGKVGDPRAVEPLITALKNRDGLESYDAAKALQKIGAPAVEPLIAALADPNTRNVKVVIETLGSMKDGRAVEPLMAALRDRGRVLRGDIVKALGHFGGSRVMQAIHETKSEMRMRLENANPVGPQSAKLLDELEYMALPNLAKTDERAIKAPSGLYSTYLVMTGYWHGFEGTREEAFEHLWIHFSQDHPDSRYTNKAQVQKGGSEINIIASGALEGYQHFVWRTTGDKYILMLSDFS